MAGNSVGTANSVPRQSAVTDASSAAPTNNGSLPHIVADSDSSSEEEDDDDNEQNQTQRRRPQQNNNDLAVEERDKIRHERRKERVRELRMEHHKTPRGDTGEEAEGDERDGVPIKKARLDGDRDVSEKIALGVHTGSGGATGGVDSRLYNQSAGLVHFVYLWSIRGLFVYTRYLYV